MVWERPRIVLPQQSIRLNRHHRPNNPGSYSYPPISARPSHHLNCRLAPHQWNSSNMELGLGAPGSRSVRPPGPTTSVPDLRRGHAHLLYHANRVFRRVRYPRVTCRCACSYRVHIPVLRLLRVRTFSECLAVAFMLTLIQSRLYAPHRLIYRRNSAFPTPRQRIYRLQLRHLPVAYLQPICQPSRARCHPMEVLRTLPRIQPRVNSQLPEYRLCTVVGFSLNSYSSTSSSSRRRTVHLKKLQPSSMAKVLLSTYTPVPLPTLAQVPRKTRSLPVRFTNMSTFLLLITKRANLSYFINVYTIWATISSTAPHMFMRKVSRCKYY